MFKNVKTSAAAVMPADRKLSDQEAQGLLSMYTQAGISTREVLFTIEALPNGAQKQTMLRAYQKYLAPTETPAVTAFDAAVMKRDWAAAKICANDIALDALNDADKASMLHALSCAERPSEHNWLLRIIEALIGWAYESGDRRAIREAEALRKRFGLKDLPRAEAAIERAFPPGFDILHQQQRKPIGWDSAFPPAMGDRVSLVIGELRRLGLTTAEADALVAKLDADNELGGDPETARIVRERLVSQIHQPWDEGGLDKARSVQASIARAFPEGFDINAQQARRPKGWSDDAPPAMEDRVRLVVSDCLRLGLDDRESIAVVDELYRRGKLGVDAHTAWVVRERLVRQMHQPQSRGGLRA
jgi:hypothetical protein